MREELFNVTGMSCSACSSRVEKTVSKMKGTEEVSVNLLTGTMKVRFDESAESIEDIIREVDKAGYGASIVDEVDDSEDDSNVSVSQKAFDETKEMKHRLIWSVVFWIPLVFVFLLPFILGYRMNPRPITSTIVQMVLLAPIVFLNRKFFKSLPGMFRGNFNMDTLIALGSGISIGYGIYGALRLAAGFEFGDIASIMEFGNGMFFQSAGTILTLITIGKYLETKSKGKTSEAIEELINLTPKKATVIRDGKEVQIKSKDLIPGDIILVRPGESFAADGRVIEGSTSVDQAVITGESIPVYKGVGDEIVTGSVNQSGFVKIKCEKTGKDTAVSRIISLVQEAAASKAPIAKLADKIAGIFVPAVLIIALITGIVWYIIGGNMGFSLKMAITVMVISCPCALGLATPLAIMTGTGRGAQKGILIKSGEAYQMASEIDTIVFDKTGTITEGRPEVTDVKVYGNISEEEFLEDALSIEEGSGHPLSKAVKHYAKSKGIKGRHIGDIQSIAGRGVKGIEDGSELATGNPQFMKELGIDISEVENEINSFSESGKTPLIFAKDGQVSGIIAVMDRPRPEAKEAMNCFRKMGIKTVMLTGDNAKVAKAIGDEIEIDEVKSQLLPEDKEKYIADLQKDGRKVAMTGDGINDAPALVRADVGIAIGTGTDVAMESADVILTGRDIRTSVTAIELSKAVMKNIKENLAWAFGYNVILIPLASGILIPATGFALNPMIGSLFMSLSSVIVVLNALRLRLFKGSIENSISLDEVVNGEKEDKTMNYELNVKGMMCMHCQNHVYEALKAMENVKNVDVDFEKGIAKVEAESPISEDEFKTVITEEGYELTGFREI